MRFAFPALAAWALASCARPDPAYEAMHARSAQQAQAMLGKDYVFTGPAWVCPDPAGVYNLALAGSLTDPGCRMVSAGRFQVQDVIVLRHDGRTVLRIAGPDVSGYTAYFAFLPEPFKDVRAYFPSGK